MYQSIHVTSGYSHFKINSNGPIGVSKKNQRMIDALLKIGNRFTAPFGGFIEAKNVIGLKFNNFTASISLAFDEY
nr:hypothetical protein [Vibrio lentus]MCC4838902.1 hypothetical protein [Vibrio lentus]